MFLKLPTIILADNIHKYLPRPHTCSKVPNLTVHCLVNTSTGLEVKIKSFDDGTGQIFGSGSIL